jgi:hypothetical protein
VCTVRRTANEVTYLLANDSCHGVSADVIVSRLAMDISKV